jgi:hypothetical protein
LARTASSPTGCLALSAGEPPQRSNSERATGRAEGGLVGPPEARGAEIMNSVGLSG